MVAKDIVGKVVGWHKEKENIKCWKVTLMDRNRMS